MRIFMTGASGLLGQALCRALAARGDTVVALSRGARAPTDHVTWLRGDAAHADAWIPSLSACDGVINLAGESVAQRWTAASRAAILASRVGTTQALARAIKASAPRPRVLVSTSASGYYGFRLDDTAKDEQAPAGPGFLADVCRQWEAAAADVAALGVRTVRLRLGVVLAAEGGALPKLALPLKGFAGGALGHGRQWMSWIHIEDAVRLYLWALDTPGVAGVVNAVAPEAARNGELTRALGAAMHRPVWLNVPGAALKLLYGEMADEALLGGQRVAPKAALAGGFRFTYPRLPEALASLAGHL